MKKSKKSTIILIVVFLVGLSLLLYPTVSNYWNSFHQSRAIVEYERQVNELDNNKYEEIMEAAHRYNEELAQKSTNFTLTEEEKNEYKSQLNFSGDGMMGYVDIPSINVSLPIYHGTDEAVLQIAAGHIEGSSLPVGGKGTHAVLSGHRGLPSAKLFTDIDKMVVGDIFFIRVLDESYAYQVDQIHIVLPEETEDLVIDPENDFCTLVTCTPYGINTHRLLVRGTRIENPERPVLGHVQANAVKIEPMWIAPIIAVPILIILLVTVFIKDRRKK